MLNKIKRFALIIYLFLFLSLFCSGDIFAALTITGLSTDTINSSDDILIINASASGLQNGKQYLEVAFTKDGESTNNYFGLTLNSSNEWYQYKSSPLISDITSYFYNFTPVNGAWVGQIQTKVDISDSGFKGPGKYNVKLLKFITSSSTSTNSLSLNVNVLPPPTDTPTPVPTDPPTPTSIPIPPTSTPTPKPTQKSSLKPTQKPSPTISKLLIATGAGFLRESSSSSKIAQKPKKIEVLSVKDNTLLPKLLVLTGIVFIVACAIVFFYPYIIKFKNKKNE